MKTIILPGYSLHNKDWAIDIKSELKLEHEVTIHNWLHWTRGNFSLPRELKAIQKIVGEDEINIIAKSVGTRVAMHLLTKFPNKINKVVLCGIPTKGESVLVKKIYSEGLSVLSPTQVIVFQNTKDPFASYAEVKRFIGSINSKIKIIEKSRSDHNYPYPKEFEKFLN